LNEAYEASSDSYDICYHRCCYQRATNKDHIERAQKKFKKNINTDFRQKSSLVEGALEYARTKSTRSSVTAFCKNLCFFCQVDDPDQSLHDCMSMNMGQNISDCIVGYGRLEIKMNTGISGTDARAMDLKYHLKCYVKQKRLSEKNVKISIVDSSEVCIRSAELEFVSQLDSHIREGAIVSIVDCEQVYTEILSEYGIDSTSLHKQTRPYVRKLITENISHVKIVNRSGRNPATVFSTEIETDVLDIAVDSNCKDNELKILMKAAKILRSNIQKFEQSREFAFSATLVPTVGDVTPQLYTFFKVLIAGTKRDFLKDKREHTVEVAAVTQSLNVTYAMKSDT